MIQPWVPRKILSDLGERPVCSRQAQESRERSGQKFWRDFFPLQENSMGGPSALDLFPLSNQYFRLAVPGQAPSASPSVPVLYVKGPVPPWLSEQLMAKALHPGLGELSSPASTLVLLIALSSPLALAEPGLASLFFQTSEMLLLLQRMRTVTTHTEKRSAPAPSRGGRFAGEGGSE